GIAIEKYYIHEMRSFEVDEFRS
ncbi:hypothetical protein EVA_04545, partial [gut metagenome]